MINAIIPIAGEYYALSIKGESYSVLGKFVNADEAYNMILKEAKKSKGAAGNEKGNSEKGSSEKGNSEKGSSEKGNSEKGVNEIYYLGFEAEKGKKNIPKEIMSSLMRIKSEIMSDNFGAIREKIIMMQVEKLKEKPKPDETIIRLAGITEDSQRSLNSMGLRFEQLLDLYYPEAVRSISDYKRTAELFLFDETKIKGGLLDIEIDEESRETLRETAKHILGLESFIQKTEEKIKKILKGNYPFFTEIATEKIAYRLIKEAGSFESLVKMHSSKIQLLGAEKALFRHLRNKKYAIPKYGFLHEHPLMSKTKKEHHGKMARLIADKMSIASKMDYFGSKDKKYFESMAEEIMQKAKEYSKGYGKGGRNEKKA